MTLIDLYPHQEEALSKLQTGSILCGGVGTGKSRTALAYYFQQCGGRVYGKNFHVTHPKDLYIITTAQKRDTMEWDDEFSKFCLSKKRELSVGEIQVTVDSWNNIKKYVDVKDAFFIFDEQKVVGYGVWSKSFIKISKNNDWILLSATPGDTWLDYIPVFIANGFYKNKTEFIRRHAVYDRYSKYPRITRFLEVGHLEKLKKQILVTMPYARHTIKHVEKILVAHDEDLIDIVFKNRWNCFYSKPLKNITEVCYWSRRVCNSHLERLDKIKEIIKDKKKVIIFYNFDYELYILRTLNNLDGLTVAEWNGHKHEEVPITDSWAYLVQYTSGCEGWNCITTDTIIFYSLNYSYKIMKQASGRIDRMNTPFTDLYYYLFYTNAKIDKAILKAIKNKKNFNEKDFESIS